MNKEDVLARLDEHIKEAGRQGVWAIQHGLSQSYVSDVIHRRREPGASLLRALGLEAVIIYRERTK